jgi:fibronectin type 3 domain-containing protein
MRGKLSVLILFTLAITGVASAAPKDFYAGAFAAPRSADAVVLEKEVSVPAGQTVTGQHSVTLTWADGKNPSGVTYTVYRATGLCSGTPTFSKLATAVAVLTYADSTVTPGNYCYQVTASVASVESAPSNQAAAAVPSFPPTSLAATVQ